MPYAVGDLLVERNYRILDAWMLHEKRQEPDPEPQPEPQPSATATTPSQPSSTPAPTTTSSATSSSVGTTSTPPDDTSSAPTGSSTSVSSPIPTDPGESSSVASQPSISTNSEVSTQSIASTRSIGGGSGPSTQIITSVITTGGRVSSVTVVYTSNVPASTSPASSNSDSTNVGAIVGGVVGGVGGLLLLIALIWFIRRKTKKDQFEENMFAPDRNVDRGELDLAGDDVNDPEAVAHPYQLPASPTHTEMAMSANSRPLSAQSIHSQGRPLSGTYDAAGMARPTSGTSYYTQPGPGMGMPMPMPMSLDHIAYAQSQANSTFDRTTQPSEPTTSEGGSSSTRMLKEREARRLHVANDSNGVIVHSDGGRVEEEENEADSPREIPPTYDSISGPSGSQTR